MPRDEPPWWYAREADPRAGLLEPVARIYGRIAGSRLARPPAYRSSLPVLCVGNFTAGGTGKTPLALRLAEMLAARNLSPAFLTRGYGGRKAGPAFVEVSVDTARDVGDEPLLLARAAPTLISPDRAAGARMIEARLPHVGAIIMDDGLQNPGLAKDLSIAVIDAIRGIGNGRIIPAGPLRAPLARQLAVTHAIIVNHPPGPTEAEPAAIIGWLRDHFPGPVLAASAGPAADTQWLVDRPVLAFAGIANPGRFFALLGERGARITETVAFKDHHAFSESEAVDLLARAERTGAQLVTTEKDLVRLTGEPGSRGALAAQARALPIRLVLDARDTMRLEGLIDGACRQPLRGVGGHAP